ncbi:helix-turn-helix transcriptional regulator [Cedecea neteri]|uniref:AlpA family phage regulatory protein n=1 Tax=Cedecea neteri TaxID=158822 RepID=A0A291DZX2_9ENTR|nr:AlpA family transcriptional regulator [Cedecea neteri]ATF93370.1 AlpA family phage regulatory protein [Cedecea neteri]
MKNNNEQSSMRNEKAVKRFIRVPEVLNRVGFSRTTLYERIKDGSFPDRVKIGLRSIAFIESEVDEWIEKTIQNTRYDFSKNNMANNEVVL